ncbi:MAG: TonB-dependent siderophore receptor [Acidovorax sp.]
MRQPRFALAPLALAALLAAGAVGTAQAQSATAPTSIAIASQPLGQALNELSRQAGLQLLFPPALVAGKMAPAVSGSLTPNQALDRLLAGSGLTATREGNAVVIKAVAPAGSSTTLQEVKVVADAVRSEPARLNPPTMVGSKTPLAQREIAQSLSVVTQEQIQAQNLNDMNDALRKTPGMVVTPYRNARADLFSRGFPVDAMQLDGVPLSLAMTENGLLAPDLAMYDRVETLRGPAGLYNGFGGPGGTVNLVRKRPLNDLAATAEMRLGTNHEIRAMADLSTPLNQDKTVRARIVASSESTHLYQDSSYKRPSLLYGVVEADLTPDTKVDIGASYQRLSMRNMAEGYPAFKDYRLISHPSRAFLGGANDFNHYEASSAFFDLEHKLGGDWRLKLSGTHLYNRANMQSDFPCCGGVDPVTGITAFSQGSISSGHNTQDVLDAFVDGPFDLAGRQHHVTLGMNYLRSNNYIRNVYGKLTTVNIFDPIIPPPYAGGSQVSNALNTVTTQYTAYGNARFKLADPLTLVLGGNAMWWKASVTPVADENPFGNPASSDKVNAHITPYGGLLYDIDKTYTAYASYSSIYTPQSVRDKNGQLIKPMKGEQYEVGIKGTHLDGKLNTGLALFQITQENRAVADPHEDPYSGIYLAQGKARSRGLEATVSGQVLPGLNLYAGYAYTRVRSLDSSGDTSAGLGAQVFSAIAPKHSLKLWADYQLPGQWRQYSVGAGLNVSSSYYYDDGVGRLTQHGYATADLKLRYVINDHLDASLYISNLFNRSYYESVGSTWNQNFLGSRRAATLTLRWTL